MRRLFSVAFTDKRERKHVAVIFAASPRDAVRLITNYQEQYDGFYWRNPSEKDVVEIRSDVDMINEPVQVVWHEDYD